MQFLHVIVKRLTNAKNSRLCTKCLDSSCMCAIYYIYMYKDLNRTIKCLYLQCLTIEKLPYIWIIPRQRRSSEKVADLA